MSTLTEIQSELTEIYNLMELVDDADAMEQLDKACMTALSDLKTKVDSYIFLIRKLEADAHFLGTESKRMKDLANSKSSLAKRLKTHLLNRLTDEDMKRLNTSYYSVSVCCNGGKQPMVVTEDLPKDEFPHQYVCKEIKLDMEAIRIDCERSPNGILIDDSGNEIARLLSKSSHLRIK